MRDRDKGTLGSILPEHLSEIGLVSQDETSPDTNTSHGWSAGIDQTKLFRTIARVQAVWMILMLVLLFGIDMLSPELYYIVSFHGLLGVRLLFAPTDQPPDWWQKLDLVVYVGFIILIAIIFQASLQLPQ